MIKYSFYIRTMDPKPLTWWRSRQNKIDMSPPYQRRGRLWSDADKAYLIDSIINGFDIPKLYMADFTVGDSSKLNKKKLPYAIIDGKQRLEAIFDFFNDEVVLNDDFIYLADPSLKLGGLGYKDLVSNYHEIAETIETYPLTVMSVHADTEEPINELFVRLNRNKPLSGAEIRNAMVGPAPELIRKIAAHKFFDDNIYFSVKRGADLNTSAKILCFEFDGEPVDTKKSYLDDFASRVREGGDHDRLELAARRAKEYLDVMSEIFLPRDKLLSSSGLIPVYYWFCRQRSEEEYYLVREFLVAFEGFRKGDRPFRIRGKISLRKGLDDRIFEFNKYNRSTNDLQSHINRIEILEEFFEIWRADYKSKV